MPAGLRGLWQDADFRRLWLGQTISAFGTQISAQALPIVAILTLHATTAQVGLLFALAAAPALFIGLPAGVVADRLPRRPLLIAVDLLRGAVLLSIPLAYLAGSLSLGFLYGAAAVTGALTVIFDVAYRAYLPFLVRRSALVEANAKLATSEALAELSGPACTGLLVQALSAPITVLIDAGSFMASAASLGLIRKRQIGDLDGVPAASGARGVGSGLRMVLGHPLLRPLALGPAVDALFGNIIGALYAIYLLRTLSLGPAMLGITVAAGGASALAGSLLAERWQVRLGAGPAIIGGMLVAGGAQFLLPAARGGVWPAFAVIVLAQLSDAARTIWAVNVGSLRQALAAPSMLGRVAATSLVLESGLAPLGLLAGGLLGQELGLRPALVVAASGKVLAAAIPLCSPLRSLRRPSYREDEPVD